MEQNHINIIIQVKPLESYKLNVKFDDGLEKVLDIKPYITSGISESLKDPGYFGKVFIEGGTITWPNGYDFCPVFVRNEM